jgi:HSP20 family protein
MESEGQLTIDVYQTPQDIIIKSAVAGVKPEDIDISITNDMVTIKGKREVEDTIKSDDYFYQECYWGRFSRSVILPVDVDSDRVAANLKNGILTVKLPKVDKAKVKKIKIKSDN